MTAPPLRLALVMTHPTQYYAPWFRQLHEHCPELDIVALYAAEPTPEQQGVGFGRAFAWDVPLREGYPSVVCRPAAPGDDFHSSKFRGVDAPTIGAELRKLKPDVALVFGWYSISLLRALWACRRQGIPVLYRGDTHLGNAPGGWRRLAWRAKTRALLRGGFDGYLAVGTKAREYLRSFGVREDRLFDSPHCVDNAFFAAQAAPHQTPEGRRAARARFGLDDGAFVALFAGKLEAIKRPADVLEALMRIRPGAAALFVGAGPLEAELRQRAEALGVRAAFAGFLNQKEMAPAFGAADCMVLPSHSETWGLIANEALACGLPCVLSDRVGAAPDAVVPGVTGETFPMGDAAALAQALERVRQGLAEGRHSAAACRQHAERFSFAAATQGLAAACQAVAKRPGRPRALALFGYMYIMGGLERQSFEVLRTLKRAGGAAFVLGHWRPVHEDPQAHAIRDAARAAGYGFATGYFSYGPVGCRSLGHLAKALWCMIHDSWTILRTAWRFRPTHVLVPDWPMALQSLFPLLLLRLFGVRTILRVGNAPERKRRDEFVWRWLLPRGLTRMVANSGFGARRMRECRVPERKIGCVRNRVAALERDALPPAELAAWLARRRTIVCVGQVAPFKGTALAVEAVRQLLDAGHDLQLLIVGTWAEWPDAQKEYVEALRRRLAEAPHAERFRAAGQLPQVTGVMRQAWLLVAPILQEETFGNVVLEAKSVGLPSVVFGHGGLTELVEHGTTGRIAAAPTAEDLAAEIAWYLEEPARRDAHAAACRAFFDDPACPYRADNYEAGWRAEFGLPPPAARS